MPEPSYTDLVVAIYQAAVRPELWASTLELVTDHLGVDSGMMLHLSASGDGNFIVHHRLRDDLNQLFLQHHTENPYSFAFARAPVGKALVTGELVEKAVLHRSAFHADILAPQDIEEIIAVRHADLSRDGVGGVLFNVSKARADAAGHAAARLDDLVPHLSRAIDLTLLTSRANAGNRQLEQLLANMPGAVILLDGHGGILQMTPAAETLLGERDGLCTGGRGPLALRAHGRDDASRLAACIKQALASARGEQPTLDDTLQVSRPSGRRALLVRVTPLPPPAFLPWSTIDGGARAMVHIVDPQAPIDAQAERLRRLVGLTAAETRVAALLASGLGPTEAAGVLGLSVNTVKTHARQVFAKAEVRSAAALARLVASIPAGPPQPAAMS